MPRGLRVRKIPLPQIVFVFMDDESASQQVRGRNSVDQIAVMSRFRAVLFYIPQISCMSGFFRTRLGAMIARCPDMEVFTGTHTAFAPQIPCLVNMESVFSFGQLGKGNLEARGMAE